MTVEEIIQTLGLEPLPVEGGLTVQTYRSTRTLDGQPAGTAIYYLLRGKAFSHLHQLTGDEMYHFYLGDPVELTQLLPDGTVTTTLLGQDLAAGQRPQLLVPAGVWQGSRLAPGGRFALLGTTMWPGYTPACYRHGDAAALLRQYPQAADRIALLTGEAAYE